MVFSGVAALASSPIAAAMLKVDKSQYPQLFDTVVSSSIDSLQRNIAPKENKFSAEHFGFNPIPSQGFHHPGQAARLVQQPQQHQQQQQHQQHQQHPQQLQPYTHLPIRQQIASPLLYDIKQIHDAEYKVYKPEEENEQGEDILSALKQNPSVSSYFQPAVTNLEVAHPLKYHREELDEDSEVDKQNYKPNAYVTGPARIRRYARGRSERLRKSSDEDDDPYDYKEYRFRPKAFDSDSYSSAYKEDKDPKKDYEYPFGSGYDSGYDHKEYERIKSLSEKQAAEIKQNPGNCKEVLRDGMTCMTCKDPKTGGNYESCSYVAEPKNNQYAYSKEKKFDSNDEPDEPEQKGEQPKKAEKYQEAKDDARKYSPSESDKTHSAYKKADVESDDKYKTYYSPKSAPSEALRSESSESDSSEEKADPLAKPYNYKQALPGFYSDTEPKKDVEHVLAEFKKKDRSACKKVQKNGMTCFQCIDENGLKNEECMFVSESAPKRSHLAYQEVKEFTSKPPTLDAGHEGAESRTVSTSAPPAFKPAALVVSNPGYGKKLKRKKARQPKTQVTAAASLVSTAVPATQPILKSKVKRSVDSEAEFRAEIVDETNVAPPEEFAGSNSNGAFWAETRPRYSAALGVTLPEFMLARSEHEASFDETVAGA